MNLIAGIDPGLGGAIALIKEDGSYFDVIDMPVMSSGTHATVKRRVNACEVSKYLSGKSLSFTLDTRICHACIERVASRPGEGVCSVFSFGHSAGIVEGVIAAQNIPYTLVTPAEWKREFGLLHGDKEQSRTKAIQLFPQAPLNLKKHEGRAEALLLALYLWRKTQYAQH